MQLPVTYIALVLTIPLIGGLITYFVPVKGIHLLSPVFLSIGLILSAIMPIFPDILFKWKWVGDVILGIQVDGLSSILISLVYFVSLLVNIFSIHYMREEPGINRYYFKLGFFTTSMIGLLLSDHLILLFVFWELVGFSSYLLIGYWFRDVEKAKSARVAFMVNRVADAGLLIGIILLITVFDISYLSKILPLGGTNLVTFVGLMLAIGAFGKSAQFPFFGWLNKAMAGPTPVSALIHAATMVTAGVYLLVRVSPMLTDHVLMLIALVGSLTALIAGISAIFQNDIKAVLAYSTISQLGYMVLGIGVGAIQSSVFHLWTHAFFKAGLFLAAGCVINFMHQANHAVDGQDMRNMGGLKKFLPFTFFTFLICGAALAGLPFTAGFLSKEGILISSMSWFSSNSGEYGSLMWVVNVFAFGAAACTPIYISRQILLVFFDKPRTSFTSKIFAFIEPLITVKLPLFLLMLGSVWFLSAINPFDSNGWFFSEIIFKGVNVDPSPAWIGSFVMGVSLLLATLGIGLMYFVYRPGARNIIAYKESWVSENVFVQLFYTGWHIDKLYLVFNGSFLIASNFVFWFDKKIIDKAVNGVGISAVVLGKITSGFDRLVVDGLVNLIARIFRGLGGITTRTQSPEIQTQLSFLLLLLIFLMYCFL